MLERIKEARNVVRMCEGEVEEAKEALKEAKSCLDDAVKNLMGIIDKSNERELEFPDEQGD